MNVLHTKGSFVQYVTHQYTCHVGIPANKPGIYNYTYNLLLLSNTLDVLIA